MLKLVEKLADGGPAADTLTLSFELRQKSRLRARLDGSEEVGLFLPRGTVLRDGDKLLGEDGRIVQVKAAAEKTSTATTEDRRLFSRACYHLGNRHVPLQIEQDFLRYLHDPVLDEMMRALGLQLIHEKVPFEPEAGAYDGHGH